MAIKNIDELYIHSLQKQKIYLCCCEKCKKEFTLIRIKNVLKRSYLLCRSCQISFTKQHYSLEKKEEIIKKREKSLQEKYGVSNAFQLEKVKELSRNRDWTERNKHTVETCIKKYGVSNGAKTKISKANTKKTLIEKYGSIEESYKIRSIKCKETNLRKRGVTSNFLEKDFHEKSLQTQIKKYGRQIVSKRYFYNNIYFDSSWELAYYIWLIDHNINFIYQPTSLTYIDENNVEHHYTPDFLVENQYIEIKGDQFFNEKNEPFDKIKKVFWWEKYNFMIENNIKIIRKKEIKEILDYVSNNYGKNYLKSFKK